MKSNLLAALISASLLFGHIAASQAQETTEAVTTADGAIDPAQAFIDQMKFRQGAFLISEAGATINVKNGFHYLDASDAQKVLQDLWGNPPDDSVLGMIVPDDVGIVGAHSWAVALTYSDDGYVSDEDATAIDYNELLQDMKKETGESNEWRVEQGYGKLDLIGWAAPPRYDASGKKLHWAKEIAFDGEPEHTLNYDVRVLGRGGYLSMNAIASVSDLERVKTGMEKVMAMTEFNSGQRYADFDSSSDKVAGYGLAALVGGAVAAKTGLFAKLFAVLLAGKKFVILGFAALAAAAKGWFGKKKQDQ
jgi:uncharacterized membrane-anchored protein